MGHHVHWLCTASVLLAVLASWVLLPLTDRYHASSGRARWLWLAAGSASMGTGIWAMHFTAMLAFSLPVPIRYDIGITFFSMVPAMLATCLCVQLFIPEPHTPKRSILMAAIMAAGIGSMHYIGMEAIVVPATMYYVPEYFFLSIVAAFFLALIGLYSYKQIVEHANLPKIVGKLIGSSLLGVAVSGMHFTAMKATYFQPQLNSAITHSSILPFDLVVGIAAVTIVLVGMVVIGLIIDGRLETMASSLAQSEQRFRSLAETTHTAIFTFNSDSILYANPALSEITGHQDQDILQRSLAAVLGEEFSRVAREMQSADKIENQAIYQELQIETAGGNSRWLYFSLTMMEVEGDSVGLGSAFDISEQKTAELNMRQLAYHDQLTRIGNRMMFMDRLEHHLDLLSRRRSAYTSCIMLLDLDEFKAINDTFGHQAGDQLLVSVAERLTNVARKTDTVARLGGDEFVILLEEMDTSYTTSIVADRITDILSRPYRLMGRELIVTCSIGVVELSSEYEKPDQALHDADIALYRAKKDPKFQWVLFDQDLDSKVKRRRLLRSELQQALKDRSLELYYQPIVGSEGYRVLGFEALARWQRDCGEWVAPDEFIPLAEDAGMITDIGIWALEAACEQLSMWSQETTNKQLYVSVNISPVSLDEPRFIGKVVEMLKRYDFDAGQLKIELTETMLVGDLDKVLNKLNTLIALGCELMIDDFGTGYSSLSYLHRLPIRTVKIDRSFVSGLLEHESSAPIVKTIIALAASLNMNVVSEGVETELQAQRLSELGADQLQGYLFSRPLPAFETYRFLSRDKAAPAQKSRLS